MAAPIFDYTGKVVGSIGCSAYTVNGNCDEVIARLRTSVVACSKQLSMRLGGVPKE